MASVRAIGTGRGLTRRDATRPTKHRRDVLDGYSTIEEDRMTATWDLERIFAGGTRGTAFLARIAELEEQVEAIVAEADAVPPVGDDTSRWAELLIRWEALAIEVRETSGFAHAWACAATDDRDNTQAEHRAQAVFLRVWRALVPLRDGLTSCDDAAFAALRAEPALQSWGPWLENTRAEARLLLPLSEQSLVTELSRDAVHAWSSAYDRISGGILVDTPRGELSVAQAFNLLSSPDPTLRAAVAAGTAAAWEQVAEPCAEALSAMVGWRQTLNDRRNIDELAETLSWSRMEPETLAAMNEAVAAERQLGVRYLALKAELLGKEKLAYWDLRAPVGASLGPHDWERSCAFVLEHFESGHPELAAFARHALESGWVEAEDRAHKRQGGWCGWWPASRESRIFMTHGGNMGSTMTLAHELGHAFHNHVMREQAPHRRDVPMTLAETASVFAENLVRDAALKLAANRDQRLALLDARLQAAASFLMNIPARFAFERELYRLRRSGSFDVQALCDTMVACQKEAYGDALSHWDPWFWASKLHFYIGSVSFYNFPYTFGYLFSTLVYQRVQAEGEAFRPVYADLLRRAGWERAEPLAQDILGVDLRDPATWSQAMTGARSDLAAFEALVRQA